MDVKFWGPGPNAFTAIFGFCAQRALVFFRLPHPDDAR
jgi:hypothetical protein